MISLPFRRPRPSNIATLYGMIVAQARLPTFYRDYGVPDTVEARLDMIVLHLVLLLRRLSQAHGGALPPLGQGLFDHFCRDIDGNLREMGVGDLSVPKKMRKVGEAFYGRANAYERALDANDQAALEVAVARNVFGMAEITLGVRSLAAYMRNADTWLASRSPQELTQGTQPVFPPFAAMA
jgi:cytochrome b pre-mRNA-processing protein 3